MSAPIIDVLLPVYNAAATIRESINSIRSQTVHDLRIIIIDDGSTDNTPAVLAALAREDSRLFILTKSNCGIVDALNYGLRRCQAEFIARQDADDHSDPTRLALQINYLKTHKNCVAVSCGARHIDLRGRPTGQVAFGSRGASVDPFSIPAKEPYLLHPFLMMRHSAIKAVGGYRYVYNAEDTDLYWRLSQIGYLHIDDAVLGSYRMHAGSISGGAILNGRITAVGCQLAALSARRRQAGKPDIPFPKEAIEEYKEAESLQGIYDLARRALDANEARYLRMSTSAKLLQMAGYRPYVLEIEDAHFIRDAYIQNKILFSDRLADFRFLLSTTAAHLVGKCRLREAITLIPLSLIGELAFRIVAPFLPPLARRAIMKLTRRIAETPSKDKYPPSLGLG